MSKSKVPMQEVQLKIETIKNLKTQLQSVSP